MRIWPNMLVKYPMPSCMNREDHMSIQVKRLLNLILAGIALAMGVAVIVQSLLRTGSNAHNSISMLSIAITALALLAIGNLPVAHK